MYGCRRERWRREGVGENQNFQFWKKFQNREKRDFGDSRKIDHFVDFLTSLMGSDFSKIEKSLFSIFRKIWGFCLKTLQYTSLFFSGKARSK